MKQYRNRHKLINSALLRRKIEEQLGLSTTVAEDQAMFNLAETKLVQFN